MLIEIIQTVADLLGFGGRVVVGLLLMVSVLYWRRLEHVGGSVASGLSTLVIVAALVGLLIILGMLNPDMARIHTVTGMLIDIAKGIIDFFLSGSGSP